MCGMDKHILLYVSLFHFRVRWQNWGKQLWRISPDVQSRWQSPAFLAKTAACGSQKGPQNKKLQRTEHLRSVLSNDVVTPDRVLLASNTTEGRTISHLTLKNHTKKVFSDLWHWKINGFQVSYLAFYFLFPMKVNILVSHKEENIRVGAQNLQLNDMNLLWAFCSHLALCWDDNDKLIKASESGNKSKWFMWWTKPSLQGGLFSLFTWNIPLSDKVYETTGGSFKSWI